LLLDFLLFSFLVKRKRRKDENDNTKKRQSCLITSQVVYVEFTRHGIRMKNEGQRTLSELPKEVQSDARQITQIEVGITLLVLVLLSLVPWCSDDISPNPAFSRPPLQISTELSVLSRSWRDDFSQYGVCTGQQTPESVLVRHRGRIIVRLGVYLWAFVMICGSTGSGILLRFQCQWIGHSRMLQLI